MKKIIFLLFISTIVFASNPKSIHWSSQGKYLVNQNGERTHIEGHPLMACYEGPITIKGKFLKEVNGKIFLMTNYKTIIQIDKPVCDVLN